MKRKTNLFYSTGIDSNFLTFSNYTESLTGNILVTNSKMFPSKFICLYIPTLDEKIINQEVEENIDNNLILESFEERKADFIKRILVGYYENKLAILRDNLSIEDIDPLDYLLEAIRLYDENFQITFIGDICEQEYNGTFMDNICIIESSAPSNIYKYIIDSNQQFDENSQIGVEDFQYLYGWKNSSLPDEYSLINPKYDDTNNHKYYKTSNSTIDFFENIDSDENIDENEEQEETSECIKFNILIPLFDVYNYNLNDDGKTSVNYKRINRIADTPADLILHHNSELKDLYDVPLGIWFSDKVIELNRELEINGSYRPSWSLCISSQFKPFPYGDEYPNEISEDSNLDKFASFAMIMAKQAYILNEFDKLSQSNANLSEKINNIELITASQLETTSSMSSTLNLDQESIEDLQEKMTNVIEQIESISSSAQAISTNSMNINRLNSLINGLSSNYDTLNTFVSTRSTYLTNSYNYTLDELSSLHYSQSILSGKITNLENQNFATISDITTQITEYDNNKEFPYRALFNSIFSCGAAVNSTHNPLIADTETSYFVVQYDTDRQIYTYNLRNTDMSIPNMYSYICSLEYLINKSEDGGVFHEINEVQSIAGAVATAIQSKLEDVQSLLLKLCDMFNDLGNTAYVSNTGYDHIQDPNWYKFGLSNSNN